MTQKTAIIIGAGPAGLTAAYELLDRSDIKPVVLEMSDLIGGIARTEVYNGNRIDIGGHRFFSKSDRVMDWWRNILPLQGEPARDYKSLGLDVPLAEEAVHRPLRTQEAMREAAPDPEVEDRVMLVRRRLSRILFLRKLLGYPISLSFDTLRKLGVIRLLRIGFSYMRSSLFPIRKVRSLEDFFINRFGRELYKTFFRDYTEKVWGAPCSAIKPEWGAQRIKGLSVQSALAHALRKLVRKDASIGQKGTETSLIELFLYPKLGPGQMWETVAAEVSANGGEIHKGQKVVGIRWSGNQVTSLITESKQTGDLKEWRGDFFVSSMAVKDLVAAMGKKVPAEVARVAGGLVYRDFITVGILLKKLKIKNLSGVKTINDIVPDNWIYVQEPEVKIGRLQLFNNWSPYMVEDPKKVWIGVEYFCDEGDEFWAMDDGKISETAVEELTAIDVIEETDVIDTVVIRAPKTYPAYFGSYDRFEVVRDFFDGLENFFPVGRNGMHKYNNQDHSMLTAMTAVDCMMGTGATKADIWAVNTEQEYHEEK